MARILGHKQTIKDTGRHFFIVEKHLGKGRRMVRHRIEETVIILLRVGHTGLCGHPESVEHV